MKQIYSKRFLLSLFFVLAGISQTVADDAQFIIKGNTSKTYTDLNEADKACPNGGVIVLTNNGTLKAGSYTISKGHTLLIPFDSDNTLCGSTVAKEITPDNGYKTPKAYRTLILAKDANIDVLGGISVGGQQYATSNAMSEAAGGPGTPSGDCGVINMKNGGSITLENGSNLYVWGFITGQNKSEGNNTVGVGTITAKSGSKVYENFVIGDYRGGFATSGLVSNKEHVFPFNQYTIPNIEIPLTLEYGASEITSGNAYTNAVKLGPIVLREATTNPFNLSLISNSGSLFTMASGSTVKKWYDPQTDEQCYETTGNLSINSVKISISGASITSSDYVLPLTSSMSVNIKNGTVTIPYDIALIPGSKLVVGKDATLEMEITSAKNKYADLYVYDVKDWGQYAYSGYYWKPYNFRLTDHLTHNGKSTDGLASAELEVNGTLNVKGGNIYTTTSGGNICSEDFGKIYFSSKPNENATTTQLLNVSDKKSINVTAAKLRNASDALNDYTATTGSAANTTFTYKNHVWTSETGPIFKNVDNKLTLTNAYPVTADEVKTNASGKSYLSVDLTNANGPLDAKVVRDGVVTKDEQKNVLLYVSKNEAGTNIKNSNAENVVVKDSKGAYTAANLVITDKQPIDVPTAFTATKVSYSRANTKNSGDKQWGTICLPFALKSGTGIQYYELSEIDDNTMKVTEVAEVPANQPAIYSVASNTEPIKITSTDASIAVTSEGKYPLTDDKLVLYGVQTAPKTLEVSTSSPYYYIAQNKFWQPTKNAVTVSPQRAYFISNDKTTAKVLSIVEDGETTGISSAETSEPTIVGIYTVGGTKIDNLEKGINIVKMSDGTTKKIILK